MRNLTLLTDFYEITMGYGFFKQKKHEEEVVFRSEEHTSELQSH